MQEMAVVFEVEQTDDSKSAKNVECMLLFLQQNLAVLLPLPVPYGAYSLSHLEVLFDWRSR